jgi:hypothetical protein
MHYDVFSDVACREAQVYDRRGHPIPWEMSWVAGFIVEEEMVLFHPIGNGVSLVSVISNLGIINSGCSTPPGVVGICISHNDSWEAMAELGKEVCECMGLARGVEIVNGKCRASRERDAYSKERI